jgi:hypothetical protein
LYIISTELTVRTSFNFTLLISGINLAEARSPQEIFSGSADNNIMNGRKLLQTVDCTAAIAAVCLAYCEARLFQSSECTYTDGSTTCTCK